MPRPSSLEMVTIIPTEIHLRENFVFTSLTVLLYGVSESWFFLFPFQLFSDFSLRENANSHGYHKDSLNMLNGVQKLVILYLASDWQEV